MRLKASKPCVSANSHELSSNRHFDAFAADTIHLKKPSVGPKGLIGPPCHGAPGPRKNFLLIKSFYGGSRGAVFSKSAPLATGGKREKQ
jgi:hypothetical protein